MRFGNIRPHGRMVFNDIGGVWKRTGWTTAKCIYGQEYEKEIHVTTDVPVYAIFENQINRFQRQESENSSGPVSSESVATDVPALLEDAKVTPVVQEREVVKGSSGEGIVVENGPSEPTDVPKGLRVIFIDDDDKKLLELENCETAEIAAITSSECIRVRLPGKGVEQMDIQETFYDLEKNTLFIVLRE
jgi:hypothetical protein